MLTCSGVRERRGCVCLCAALLCKVVSSVGFDPVSDVVSNEVSFLCSLYAAC